MPSVQPGTTVGSDGYDEFHHLERRGLTRAQVGWVALFGFGGAVLILYAALNHKWFARQYRSFRGRNKRPDHELQDV
jgi:hypothetical protein